MVFIFDFLVLQWNWHFSTRSLPTDFLAPRTDIYDLDWGIFLMGKNVANGHSVIVQIKLIGNRLYDKRIVLLDCPMKMMHVLIAKYNKWELLPFRDYDFYCVIFMYSHIHNYICHCLALVDILFLYFYIQQFGFHFYFKISYWAKFSRGRILRWLRTEGKWQCNELTCTLCK